MVEQAPIALFKPASVKPLVGLSVPTLASLPIDQEQFKKALHALLAHVDKTQLKREQETLLGEQEEKVYLVVGLIRPAEREQHKPISLQLPHPVIDPKASPVTLFVKDPQREYKTLLASTKINFISRVVGLDKLRNKHKTFEAKRLLLKQAELFLVDDRVLIDVGKALGKSWREAKKQPVPVSLARKDLKGELERAVASTYLQINTGTSLSIKIGSTSLHTPAQLLENLLALLPLLLTKLPHASTASPMANIQSLHLKTSTSIALPLYSIALTGATGSAPRFIGASEEETKKKESKLAEKAAVKAVEQEKKDLRNARRAERELEKEKRELAAKEGKEERKSEKREKRKAEKEALREATKDTEVEAGEGEGEEHARKSKKSKVVEVALEVEVAPEVVMEIVPVLEKKAKKSKKVKA